jgi:hypothetical protein
MANPNRAGFYQRGKRITAGLPSRHAPFGTERTVKLGSTIIGHIVRVTVEGRCWYKGVDRTGFDLTIADTGMSLAYNAILKNAKVEV